MNTPMNKSALDQWQQRWQQGDTGFHQSEVNGSLVRYLPELALKEGDRILVPLCGKTRDIDWLMAQGFWVVAAELSSLAVEAVFARLDLSPEVEHKGELRCYRSEGLEVWQGDFFALSPQLVGAVQGVYDRGALVALPEPVRRRYAQHLMALAPTAPQLLITCDYPVGAIQGSPYAVSRTEVEALYSEACRVACLQRQPVPGGIKGVSNAVSEVWHLSPFR